VKSVYDIRFNGERSRQDELDMRTEYENTIKIRMTISYDQRQRTCWRY
jgi:hypothetical protein